MAYDVPTKPAAELVKAARDKLHTEDEAQAPQPTLDLDDEDVRLLILWAWRYAKTRNSFAPRHVKRLAERHKHLLSPWDLKEILEGGEPSSE
jgi:hypothetical protein